jgi:hypothetical protein
VSQENENGLYTHIYIIAQVGGSLLFWTKQSKKEKKEKKPLLVLASHCVESVAHLAAYQQYFIQDH